MIPQNLAPFAQKSSPRRARITRGRALWTFLEFTLPQRSWATESGILGVKNKVACQKRIGCPDWSRCESKASVIPRCVNTSTRCIFPLEPADLVLLPTLTTMYVWSRFGQRASHSSMFSPTEHALPPLSPQPPLKVTSIQSFRHQPFSSLPPRRSSEIPMVCGILQQLLDFPRLRAIFSLADHSRFVSPLRKNARSSLVAMSDADLKGVIVKPSNRGTSTTMILFLEDLN